jgi:uncharacterized membrane protein YidH (DUF202 family)
MIIEELWLIKLLIAHLMTDFILQPRSWIEERKLKHFNSGKLYLHGSITALIAWLLIGWQYYLVAFILFATHTIIDGWKSYQKDSTPYFIIDQLLHLIVIFACWYFSFIEWKDTLMSWKAFTNNLPLWKLIAGFLFVTYPAGIIIGQFTKQWSDKIKQTDDAEKTESLVNAGKWIGIAERVIVLILVIQGQYAAIGLLVTAKGIIRFAEKDRQESKTEYLVIGTLLSIGLAIVTGLMIH